MSLHIRPMTKADIPLGMRLKEQNGWNQLEADWQRQFELQSDGCFVADIDGAGVGTACGCSFGSVAWIAMVLVDSTCRNRGIGSALLRRVIDYLDNSGVTSIRLDATPAGQPVYEKLGFFAEFDLVRYGGKISPNETAVTKTDCRIEMATAADLPAILELDRQVTGTDRERLLQRQFQEYPEEMRVVRGTNGVDGFLGARPGSRAWQFGPCQGSESACSALLFDALMRHRDETAFLDIPVDNVAARTLAEAFGLSAMRPLKRMGRGPTIHEQLDKFWTSYGAEKG